MSVLLGFGHGISSAYSSGCSERLAEPEVSHGLPRGEWRLLSGPREEGVE